MATDRFSYTFDAGRATGDKTATLIWKAVYTSEVKTKEIPITVKEPKRDAWDERMRETSGQLLFSRTTLRAKDWE